MQNIVSKFSINALIKRIEKQKDRIAKERDRLRDMTSDAEDILETCQQAERDMESAIDHLSGLL